MKNKAKILHTINVLAIFGCFGLMLKEPIFLYVAVILCVIGFADCLRRVSS